MSLAADTIYKNTFKSKCFTLCSYIVVKQNQKLHHFCNRSSPDDGPRLSRKYVGYIYNYGKYINQFLLNTIKSIQQYERINKKICMMFNEICINEEMLPKYTYI